MKTLIIYAHPETKGHCSLILDEVKKNLSAAKHEFEVLDLYKIRYDPILHKEEHYTAGGNKISPKTKQIQQKIKESDDLILIYPIWWSRSPAIMEGLIDKTMTSGFAYRYEGSKQIKLLKGKKAVAIYTTGAPAFVTKFILGNIPHKLIKDQLGYCGMDVKTFQIGSCEMPNKKKDSEIRAVVKKALSKI